MTDDPLTLALAQIRREEGCRLSAYQDGGGVWTIGYGCTGPEIGPHTVWTLQQAEAELMARAKNFCSALDSAIPWWRGLSPARQAVLLEMAWQLGLRGLLAFHRALSAMEDADWAGARAAMLDSRWAQHDSPARARREAEQMLTGVVT